MYVLLEKTRPDQPGELHKLSTMRSMSGWSRMLGLALEVGQPSMMHWGIPLLTDKPQGPALLTILPSFRPATDVSPPLHAIIPHQNFLAQMPSFHVGT